MVCIRVESNMLVPNRRRQTDAAFPHLTRLASIPLVLSLYLRHHLCFPSPPNKRGHVCQIQLVEGLTAQQIKHIPHRKNLTGCTGDYLSFPTFFFMLFEILPKTKKTCPCDCTRNDARGECASILCWFTSRCDNSNVCARFMIFGGGIIP